MTLEQATQIITDGIICSYKVRHEISKVSYTRDMKKRNQYSAEFRFHN